MGWYCAIIVDGTAYQLMGGIGASGDSQIATATQLGVELTPTRTIFAMQAGPMLVNLTFFSPVTVRIYHLDFKVASEAYPQRNSRKILLVRAYHSRISIPQSSPPTLRLIPSRYTQIYLQVTVHHLCPGLVAYLET